MVGAGLVAGLLIAHRLYLSARLYPLTPVVDGLPPIPPPFDVVVLTALVVLVAVAAVVPRPRAWIVGSLGLAVMLAVTDQSRWQPWFYQYVVMLAAFALASRGERTSVAFDVSRIVICGIYVWSGVQKLNPGFAREVFPWFVRPVMAALPPSVGHALASTWVVVPLVEIGIGLGLATARFRRVAAMVAVAVHVSVVALLGPLAHAINAVVWPWNVAMAALVVLLFWRDDRPLWPATRDTGTRVACAAAALLFWVMPALSFAGMWDAYLSSALYSGNIAEGIVAMTPGLRARLPAEIDRHVVVNRAGTSVLMVWTWSMDELGAPPYPERRVFVNVARALCRYGQNAEDLKLVVVERPRLLTGQAGVRAYDCAGERARP